MAPVRIVILDQADTSTGKLPFLYRSNLFFRNNSEEFRGLCSSKDPNLAKNTVQVVVRQA